MSDNYSLIRYGCKNTWKLVVSKYTKVLRSKEIYIYICYNQLYYTEFVKSATLPNTTWIRQLLGHTTADCVISGKAI